MSTTLIKGQLGDLEKYDQPLRDALSEMATLFHEVSGHDEIGFKLGYFENRKMHPHLSENMTFALDGDGTEWEKGIVSGRTPFFMKENFLHKTPDSVTENPRPLVVFSAPTSYGL